MNPEATVSMRMHAKGHGECKSAAKDCKGQNACKGKGFISMTKAECEKVEGAKFAPAEG